MLIILLAFVFVLNYGCGRSRPSRFYVLIPTVEAKASTSQAEGDSIDSISIGIGPVKFSDYLQRPQILSQTKANELEYAEYDRWAEPLDHNFARVVAENLSNLVPAAHVFVFPWRGSAGVQYSVTFEVLRFSEGADGKVTLIVLWSIYDEEEIKLISRKKSTLIRAGPRGDLSYYQELAGIMSRMVEDLTREIAKELSLGVRPT
jgi:hypothetical protein